MAEEGLSEEILESSMNEMVRSVWGGRRANANVLRGHQACMFRNTGGSVAHMSWEERNPERPGRR